MQLGLMAAICPNVYIHYFGNESSKSLLEYYGVENYQQEQIDAIRGKQCPNCNELNKPDSKFCAKCRMVLTYDAYSETLEKQHEKESEVQVLKQKYEEEMKTMVSRWKINSIRYSKNRGYETK